MYNVIVCKIKTRSHPNADKLQLGLAHGYQVIVSLETQDNELGVFFGPDGQLSEEFCKANDLISRIDENGNKTGGYFSDKRRVRSQKFRGEKSDGFWCPLSYLKFTGFDISSLKEGDQFNELNNIPICNKYYTPATLRQLKNKVGKLRKQNSYFAKHVDTKQFKHNVYAIPKNSILYFTEKMHGTSSRKSFVLDIKEKIRPFPFNFFMKPKIIEKYDFLLGTRNVILNHSDKPGFYGNDQFRHNIAEKVKGFLHKGEVIYGEIVGYTTENSPIMSPQPITDKELKKVFGEKMHYKYGCVDGTCDFYVYRITRVNEDNNVIDLSWPQIKKRCQELNIKIVPELFDPIVYNGNYVDLIELVESMIEGKSTVDPSHIREGVCIRVENEKGIDFLKAKSYTFGVLEGYIKDADDYVDLEEVS